MIKNDHYEDVLNALSAGLHKVESENINIECECTIKRRKYNNYLYLPEWSNIYPNYNNKNKNQNYILNFNKQQEIIFNKENGHFIQDNISTIPLLSQSIVLDKNDIIRKHQIILKPFHTVLWSKHMKLDNLPAFQKGIKQLIEIFQRYNSDQEIEILNLLLLSFHSNLFNIKIEKYSVEVNNKNMNKIILYDTFLPDSSIVAFLNAFITQCSSLNISKIHYRTLFITLLSPPIIYLKKTASREISSCLSLCAKSYFSEFLILCNVLFAANSSSQWHFSLLGVLKELSNIEKELFLRSLIKNCRASDVLFNISTISSPSLMINKLQIFWNDAVFTFIHSYLTNLSRQSLPLMLSIEFLNEIKMSLLELTSIYPTSILLGRILQLIISTNISNISNNKEDWKGIIKQMKVEIMQESLESLLN